MATPTEGVTRIITGILGVEESRVTDDADLMDDLGADSLDYIDVQMECEDEFGIQITEDEVDGVRTVADLIQLVEKKIDAPAT